MLMFHVKFHINVNLVYVLYSQISLCVSNQSIVTPSLSYSFSLPCHPSPSHFIHEQSHSLSSFLLFEVPFDDLRKRTQNLSLHLLALPLYILIDLGFARSDFAQFGFTHLGSPSIFLSFSSRDKKVKAFWYVSWIGSQRFMIFPKKQ